jgi:hypothetical protein
VELLEAGVWLEMENFAKQNVSYKNMTYNWRRYLANEARRIQEISLYLWCTLVYRRFKHIEGSDRILEETYRDKIIYFCVNSGSCGSKYIVNLLRSNGLNNSYHEKKPDFNYLGIRYHLSRDHLSSDCLVLMMRLTRGNVFFESSNRLFSLIPIIKKSFPKAKFIFLHRDGRDSVCSALNVGNVDAYFRYNFRFSSGLCGPSHSDSFSKACQHWAYVNNVIYRDLQGIEANDYIFLPFEKLIKGELKILEEFMGIELRTKRIAPVNVGRKKRSSSSLDWREEDKDRFWHICGGTMKRLGYI